MNDGDDTLRLQLRRSADALEPARLAMLQHLSADAVDRQAVYRCELVLEEVLLNIVRHGGDAPSDDRVELDVVVHPDRVCLHFADAGPAFDPTAHPEPARPATLADAQPGGLGLLLVRRLTQRLSHHRSDGRNHLEVQVARTPAVA